MFKFNDLISRGVEETFLSTPFFEGMSCKNDFKFKTPEEATKQIIDISKLPVLKLEEEYVKVKVSGTKWIGSSEFLIGFDVNEDVKGNVPRR